MTGQVAPGASLGTAACSLPLMQVKELNEGMAGS
jgi:hypothetical protein